MSDPFSWTLRLGRWGGVRVSVHVLLLFFAAGKLLGALLGDPKQGPGGLLAFEQTLAWLGLLLLALALHELGHALAALRVGLTPDDVRLWPLGSLSGPQGVPVSRSHETFLVAMAGPLTSLVIAVMIGISLSFSHVHMILNPFGADGNGDGSPLTAAGKPVAAFTSLWWLGWFGYLNWIIFLANLIPALPMDGGRMLRAVLAGPTFGTSKDGLIAPWTARTFAIVLALVGFYRLVFQGADGGLTLILLAVLIEWMFRYELRMLEEGGYFEESLFGYDFSEGYTSLEGSAPKVRPHQESALARWRRRRSDARRHRREAQEAAEEQRMDEILAKIHNLGKDSLTDEEYRFMLRVSARIKGRTQARE